MNYGTDAQGGLLERREIEIEQEGRSRSKKLDKSGSGFKRKETVSERFWRCVQKTEGCWEWTASKSKENGYGKMSICGGSIMAHRVSWWLENGRPDDSLYMCHKCDNPSCVRPDHLFLGTQKENVQDMITKGRRVQSRRRLTDQQIREIKSIPKGSIRGCDIAEQYGVNRVVIYRIQNGQRWNHIQ